MPTSSAQGKVYTLMVIGKLVQSGLIRHIVDVGAGQGTYREMAQSFPNDIRWTALEAWEPYVEAFKLRELYQRVVIGDARDFDFTQDPPDIAIFGDVLEHMSKEDAVALVDRALTVTPYVVLSIPVGHHPQDEYLGNPYERHVKDDWSQAEVVTSFPDVVCTALHDFIAVAFLSRHPAAISNLLQIHPVVAQLIMRHPETYPNFYAGNIASS